MARLREIARELDQLPESDPRRAALMEQREELHGAARTATDSVRNPELIEYDLLHLKRRLAELDADLIGKSWPEKGNHRWINDPGAYSNEINRELLAGQQRERDFLEARIAQLEASLPDAMDRNRSNG